MASTDRWEWVPPTSSGTRGAERDRTSGPRPRHEPSSGGDPSGPWHLLGCYPQRNAPERLAARRNAPAARFVTKGYLRTAMEPTFADCSSERALADQSSKRGRVEDALWTGHPRSAAGVRVACAFRARAWANEMPPCVWQVAMATCRASPSLPPGQQVKGGSGPAVIEVSMWKSKIATATHR